MFPCEWTHNPALAKRKKKTKTTKHGGYKNAYSQDVHYDVRGSNRHGQARQTSAEKCFLDILSKQYLHANLKNGKKLYFWVLFLHGTREQFLSWFSWPQVFSQRSQRVSFLLLVLAWHYSYLHCLLSDWPVGSTRAFFNQRAFEGGQDWMQRDKPLMKKRIQPEHLLWNEVPKSLHQKAFSIISISKSLTGVDKSVGQDKQISCPGY